MESDRYIKARRFIYNRQHFGIKLGLHNIARLAEWLGNPHEAYNIVHVAGTNGKGSTSSFIASILQASGYRVGLLTSPHLADFRERIRVNGEKISGEDIADFVEGHKGRILRSQATFFEVTTALAFWHFQQKKVDWAVLEVGLGGRLDATNIVLPNVSVITNISLEHTNLLGNTEYKIAGEKGGIIKPMVPLVTGVENNGNSPARRFRQICREKKAPVYFHRKTDYSYHHRDGYDILQIKRGTFAGLEAKIGLAGRHQVDNAFLAARTAEVISSQGFAISRTAIKKGLASNHWPGRCMTVSESPKIIIDVAHNREGFLVLADTLKRRFPGRKFHFLVSMVEKKRGDRCLEVIAPLAQSLSVAPLRNERSDDPFFLISRLDPQRYHPWVFPDAVKGYKDLLENSLPTDILVITGSHFIMGELASYIKRDGF